MDAGKYRAEITLGTATAYVAYTIAKANPSYTEEPTGLTATYGQTLADISLESYPGWAWKAPATNVGNVGSHAFPAIYTKDNSGNYNTVERNLSVTVGKAPNPATVTAAAAVVKGGNKINLASNVSLNGASGTVSYAIIGEANGCSLSGSELTSGANTGTVDVNVTISADNNYEALETKTITVAITDKNTQTLAFDRDEMTKTYGDAPFTNALSGGHTAVTYAVTGGADVAEVNSSTGAVTIKKAGTATITATAEETNSYAGAAKSYTLTVNRKAVTVKADDKSKKKGEADPSLTATVTGLIGSDTLLFTIARQAGEDAGTYVITANGNETQGNYNVIYQPGTFTIISSGSADDNGGSDNGGGSRNDSHSNDSGSSGSSDNAGTPAPATDTSASAFEQMLKLMSDMGIASLLGNQNAQNAPGTTITPAFAVQILNNPASPAIGKTFIEGHPEMDGWDIIKGNIQETILAKLSDPSSDGTVAVGMNGYSVVPGDIFSEIKGKDVTVVFELAEGIKWSVNGMDITGGNIGDVDFAVTVGMGSIPVDVINNVTGERYGIQITLAHEGDFGFSATLSIDMDKKNAGLFANLFYYNKATGGLEFVCADKIAPDGTAELEFTHASEYTIVVDKEPMEGYVISSYSKPEETAGAGNETQNGRDKIVIEIADTGAKEHPALPWAAIIGLVVIAATAGSLFFILKKREAGRR